MRRSPTVKERFYVGSVTGWPITPSTLDDNRNQSLDPRTVWYVIDSRGCHETVAEFRRNHSKRLAEDLCKQLNLEERSYRRFLRSRQEKARWA